MRLPVPAVLTALATSLSASASGQQVHPLSLDLKDAEAKQVLLTFAQLAESRLVLGPEIEGKVTFRFDGVSWQTALTAITQGLDAVWELETTPGRSLVVRPLGAEDEPQEPLSIDLVNAPVESVFEAMAGMQRLDLDFDPDLVATITITLSDVGRQTAQDAVCESVGCTWEQIDQRLVVRGRDRRPAAEASPESRLGERVDIDLADADVEQVLSSLAALLGVEMAADPPLAGTTTIRLDGVAVREALDRVCADAFLDWGLVRRSDGWALRITPLVADTWPAENPTRRDMPDL